MRTRIMLGLLTALAFSGCGGSGSSTSPMAPAPGGSGTQSMAERAISAANALGSPVKNITAYNNGVSGGAAATASLARTTQSVPLGTCSNGVEFFAPDQNGDANSTEQIYFYDSGCTQKARDIVRIYTSTGSNSETVNRTMSLYAQGNSTAIATRTDNRTITNATFDMYGFPVAASGFDRVSTGSLNVSGSRTIDSDDEIVMLPAQSGTNQYCFDSAGFNATGIQSLGETFGWAGGVASGTRTVNADGSVTWSATHAGSAYKGPVGTLSIVIGAQNTTCPISTPMFSIGGGNATGSYSIPLTVTYKSGSIVTLTVQNATLANGDTLNVSTNASQPPTSASFISGAVTNGSTSIATFNVDEFGDGTLTVAASGAQYVMTDWHVVR